ncbi:hypothetical protein RRG08_012768 [Elysia crispata]|uniref:Uncharacterized protein n=1 Tax=Elysia crispata TaxID=231223 RepID=A0AAE0YRV9_9GAST|nr:hypothetical protein RRG08_012768 [Elysia crispata]
MDQTCLMSFRCHLNTTAPTWCSMGSPGSSALCLALRSGTDNDNPDPQTVDWVQRSTEDQNQHCPRSQRQIRYGPTKPQQYLEGRSDIAKDQVGIGADNVDRLKELMSGEKTTFERKMKSPGTCKANLVILNSNNMPYANVPGEKQALENRMCTRI